jgi:hypothetical protein
MKKIFLGLLAFSFLISPAFAQTDTTYDYDWDYSYDDFDYEALSTTSTLTDEQAATVATGLLATLLVVLPILTVVGIGSYIYFSLAFMTIAKKLNHEKPWLAWVPLANMYLYVKLAGLSGWSALLFFIPAVNFVFIIIVMMKIAEKRGFESWLGLLIIVPMLNILIPGYLAWAEPKKSE